jgi:hypothetical protein
MRGAALSRLEASLFRERQDNYRTLRQNETFVTKNSTFFIPQNRPAAS